MTLTLVGETQARIGEEFTYVGLQPECAACRLRAVCHDLAPNQRYRVTGVRDIRHPCPADFFEGGMRLAEVEPAATPGVIREEAMRGTGWTQHFDECGAICLFKRFCKPASIPEGTSCAIESVGGVVDCKVGRDLRFARLRPTR